MILNIIKINDHKFHGNLDSQILYKYISLDLIEIKIINYVKIFIIKFHINN